MIARFLSAGSEDGEENDALFNVAIATIFAREFLEGSIIIGQYRTVINRNDDWDEETKTKALKIVTYSASFASAVAILVVLAVAIPLGVLHQDLDEHVVMIIEGVSKVVASVCILQLSVKIPVWLGIYWKVSIFPWKNESKGKDNLHEIEKISFNELRFNVAWNIWREVAECGVFLIPFFLGTGAEAIPLSALVGIVIALILGIGIYFANHKLQNKSYLAFFMGGLTFFLAVGLFVGGCHEFEEVTGETPDVWVIENPAWSHKRFPMVIVKPFGYSASRTVLQMASFWCFLIVGLAYHFLKWNATRLVKQACAEQEAAENMESTPEDVLAKAEKGSSTKEGSSEDDMSPAEREAREDVMTEASA